ncbi:hypothetical protein [Beijerinckia mobilis]|uniref:hypothetical protein n=1 Tax=Beijerinckia mobilis TaxID=231434 RepID=UPI00055298FA|nr:hypothetical protein [Beijerinckia mobilis]
MSYEAIATTMLNEGCTAGQIVATITAIERAEERAKAAKREKEAEKKRHQRARAKGLSPVVPGTSGDPSPDKERSPTPPKENNPNQSPSLPARLPADFEISGEDQAFGAAEGLTEAEINRAVEDMRLWAAEAVGEKALRQDWHATARRFMRRDADAKRAGKGRVPEKGAKRFDFPPVRETLAKGTPPLVHVKHDSPQGDAWAAWWRVTKGGSPPMDRAGGWHFPAEWPPDRKTECG